VAVVCQVTPATVANWIDQGLLKGHKTPTGRRRVAADDLEQFLTAHGMAVPPELRPGEERGEERRAERIVVVDDEPAYLRALVKMLEYAELGVEVVAATTGMDALLEIGRARPLVVVLDYKLPDLNADEVVQRLLEPGRGLGAEVVVVTGGMPSEAEARLRQWGVRTIVNKVDGMDAVVEAVRRAVEGKQRAA
jgi:two-component system, OmpR family, response regulator RpaA